MPSQNAHASHFNCFSLKMQLSLGLVEQDDDESEARRVEAAFVYTNIPVVSPHVV